MLWMPEISPPLLTFAKPTTPEEMKLLVEQIIFLDMATFIRRLPMSNCDSCSERKKKKKN
jgi:hypothetical protein